MLMRGVVSVYVCVYTVVYVCRVYVHDVYTPGRARRSAMMLLLLLLRLLLVMMAGGERGGKSYMYNLLGVNCGRCGCVLMAACMASPAKR